MAFQQQGACGKIYRRRHVIRLVERMAGHAAQGNQHGIKGCQGHGLKAPE